MSITNKKFILIVLLIFSSSIFAEERCSVSESYNNELESFFTIENESSDMLFSGYPDFGRYICEAACVPESKEANNIRSFYEKSGTFRDVLSDFIPFVNTTCLIGKMIAEKSVQTYCHARFKDYKFCGQ